MENIERRPPPPPPPLSCFHLSPLLFCFYVIGITCQPSTPINHNDTGKKLARPPSAHVPESEYVSPLGQTDALLCLNMPQTCLHPYSNTDKITLKIYIYNQFRVFLFLFRFILFSVKIIYKYFQHGFQKNGERSYFAAEIQIFSGRPPEKGHILKLLVFLITVCNWCNNRQESF